MSKNNAATTPSIIGWRAALMKGEQNIVAEYLYEDCPCQSDTDKTAWDEARDFLVDEAFEHLNRPGADRDNFEDILCDAMPGGAMFQSIMGTTVFIAPVFAWENAGMSQVDSSCYTVDDKRSEPALEMAIVNSYEEEALSSHARAHEIIRALNTLPPQI